MTESINDEQVEIVLEFINEARELIEDLEPDIIGLDKMAENDELSEDDVATLNSIFRLFHSIKGGAGFLQFTNIVHTTHTAENLLDGIRAGSTKLTANHVDLLCKSCDFTKDALDLVESTFTDESMEEAAEELIALYNKDDNSSEGNPGASDDAPPESSNTDSESSPAQPPLDLNLDISMADLITPETRKKFLEEADDLLEEIEEDLLNLANAPNELAPVERLFRNIHSLKGNCGFMGFKQLEQLAHTEETLLDSVKSEENKAPGKVADMLIELLDVHKESLADISNGGMGEIHGIEMYIELLNNLMPKGKQKDLSESSTKIGDILVKQGAVSADAVEQALETQQKTIGELLVDSGAVEKKQIDKALKVQEQLRPKGAAKPAKAVKRQDIRVDLDKLDSLITLIGEMVIAENMVIHNPDLEGMELENFNKAGQHMAKIVRELQEMAMIIRMVPVSALFRRMIRLVHDLSRKSGKKVDLQISGESTEVDKTVIEKITDPMVHLIRNSMDHGLEDPEGREVSGKPTTGVIKISARHEEGEVHIIIQDDGRGMDRQKLIDKGIEKGIVEGDGSTLSDKEAYHLIFQPGFSTAEKVTDISGRGVGMDVVRQNLDAIKGRVDIDSKLGEGSTVTLRIPLTLAIIEGMQIRTGSAFYILPILSIKESFRPSVDAITVSPDGQELVKVREHLIPVIRLHELHNITPDSHDLDKGIMIVLETATKQNFCLFVDELMGQQQTVIKGLSDYISNIKDVRGVSGCTILGNGEVCLILDVRSLDETLSE